MFLCEFHSVLCNVKNISFLSSSQSYYSIMYYVLYYTNALCQEENVSFVIDDLEKINLQRVSLFNCLLSIYILVGNTNSYLQCHFYVYPPCYNFIFMSTLPVEQHTNNVLVVGDDVA